MCSSTMADISALEAGGEAIITTGSSRAPEDPSQDSVVQQEH